jgi:hypothetical protein
LRYVKKAKPPEGNQPAPYQLFATPEDTYRVLVTDLDTPIDVVVGFLPATGRGGESD